MEVECLPLLRVMREVYAVPRGPQRFAEYLRTATGQGDDLELPILSFNPMAREHVVEKLDTLLALGAEEIAAETARSFAASFRDLPGRLITGMELCDDLKGGWTNRYFTDFASRAPTQGSRPSRDDGKRRRDFATALLWVSEEQTESTIRTSVAASLYRAAFHRVARCGSSLDDLLRREGLVALFAGAPQSPSPGELEPARAVLAPLRAADTQPTLFAALYGDAAAIEAGYQPLGLPPFAGLAVALADAAEEGRDPRTALYEAAGIDQAVEAASRRRR